MIVVRKGNNSRRKKKMRIDYLKKQHVEIGEVLKKLEQMIVNEEKVLSEVRKITLIIAELSGKLKIHLTSEDKYLYPSLLDNSNSQVKSTAERFMKEMGGLADGLNKYKTQYMKSSAIKEDPKLFIKESRDIISKILKRVDAEEKRLYTLIKA